jgi:addiction module HigA family antidote
MTGFGSASCGGLATHTTSRSPTITEKEETAFMARHKREVPPVHPGEILLEEFLKPLKMNAHQLALALRVPANRIGQIVAGDRDVSLDTALRLGRYFGTGAEFWVNLQARYDIETAKGELEEKIEREVQPREQAHT